MTRIPSWRVSAPDFMPAPRSDSRLPNQLRPLTLEAGIAPYASGSVLIGFGNTRVICAATVETKVPSWMKQQGVKGGWLTAEYSMLPYSTLDRKPRDIAKGKIDGRTVEIQRLIGRSLRAVLDLQKLGENTLWVDCDVLQADGGTRTASITGAYLAARLAIQKLLDAKRITENPLTDSVAAVSVGLFKGEALLDLNYVEDKDASVDANVVMTGRGQFVEVQSSGEESTFSHDQLQELLALAKGGLAELATLQTAFLQKNLPTGATP
jgi:ribonuclease PH